jgi:TRAP-type C4-dicarboxylate transport system permease large subunit
MNLWNISSEEKCTWVSLVIILVVFTGYFSQVFEGVTTGNLDKAEIAGLFIGTVVSVIVLEIVLHIAIAIFSVKDADQSLDERDRLFSMKAGNIAGWILGVGVLIIAGKTFMGELSSLWIANLLLFSVFVSQIVSYSLKLFYYRRGY